MAIIYSYPLMTDTISGDDLLLMTDVSDSNKTKSVKVSALPSSGAGITLTTTGTSGPATLIGTVLNIPNYNTSGGGDTYTLQAEAKSSNSIPLKLDAATGTDSTVNLTEGANVTLTRNSATEITIAATGGGAGVSSFTNANGTYISAGTANSAATGAVTMGTIDLSAVDGTSDTTTRFLSKDNTWDVPSYTTDTTYDVMGSGNSYAAGLVLAGSATHNNQFLRKDGTWQTTPSTSVNTIYNADDSLTGNRTVTIEGNNLYFDPSGSTGGVVVGAGSRSSSNPMMEVVGASQIELLVNATAGLPDIGFASSGVQKAGIRANASSLELLSNGTTVGLTIDASQNTVLAGNMSKASALTISTSASNGNISIDPHGSGVPVFLGNTTRGSGQIKLNCEQNSHGITLKGPAHSASANYTLTFPTTDGNANEFLQTDGSGGLSWAAGSSSKLGFTPLSIYEATGKIQSVQGEEGSAFSIIRQSVCETDCTIDKVDFFRLAGTDRVTVAVYSGSIASAAGNLVLTGGQSTGTANQINTITFSTPYNFSAGDDIVILVSLQYATGNYAEVLGATNLFSSTFLGRENSIYYQTPPTDFSTIIEDFSSASTKGAALHFYDE